MGLSKPGENVLHFLSTSTALSAIFTLPLENDCVGIIVRRVGNTLIIESVEETDEMLKRIIWMIKEMREKDRL